MTIFIFFRQTKYLPLCNKHANKNIATASKKQNGKGMEAAVVGGALVAARLATDPWSRECRCLDLHERLPQIQAFLIITAS